MNRKKYNSETNSLSVYANLLKSINAETFLNLLLSFIALHLTINNSMAIIIIKTRIKCQDAGIDLACEISN